MKKSRPSEKPTFPNNSKPDRDWRVFSTNLTTVELMLRCAKTDAFGVVPNPTAEEWERAFHAPSHPYRWPKSEYGRVVVKRKTGARKLVVY